MRFKTVLSLVSQNLEETVKTLGWDGPELDLELDLNLEMSRLALTGLRSWKISRKVSMAVVLHEDKKQEEAKLFSDIGIERTDLGQPDTLRYRVLTMVLNERYDSAIEELREFFDAPTEYPDFKERVTRFVNHSVDLIYAIKAKRSFPGISSLTRAKQQELREKFKEHLKELQHCIKTIEKNQTDLRVSDARSTIYVVRAAWYCVVAVAVLGFVLEIKNGLAVTSAIVVDDTVGRFAEWLLKFVNL